ncbi:uncharacterized protein LACBIDRAFT_304278 [Laccaria bicolor S238N-H82]|uniref:Predicted protein n=1 Tax=Laccaria bicolor (strain S238N-H82 / ATCC MYA-4686) TaxID=486041 RepID=B0DLA4_LACBS|nr:uncharacterized protein LACBIDRAFT_304278 [Laccaria bicolor S238N-H82]EDR04530.1 predicted protein [Laccaria bicolor S238N-H82]|eukprot:XP_001884702.1 predicted protein [Laccaria bicolor S238N-H82]
MERIQKRECNDDGKEEVHVCFTHILMAMCILSLPWSMFVCLYVKVQMGIPWQSVEWSISSTSPLHHFL